MTSRIGKSLTLKWMVFSVLLATMPLAIAGFSIIQIYQDHLKKSVITIEKEKANMVVGRTRSFFEKITSNLRSLSIDEHFRQGSSPGHIKSLLENFLNQNDYLSELTLLNEKGKETIKVSKYRVFKPSDLKDQSKTEIFRVASNLRTYYGGFKLTEGIVPTIVIGVPIGEYRKRPTDVLSAEIHLRHLWNLIPQIQIGKKGTTYVVDGEGDLIAHPETTRVTSRINVKHLPMVNRALAGEEGSLEFEDSTGEKYLVVYKPIKELGWGVIVQVPVEEAYAPLRQVARTALYWILVGLTVAVIFSLFLTRKLILPIKNLSKEMREVAKGNLDTYIQPTTKDELGLLTESFNHMAQALKQSKGALGEAEEKYRTILENIEDGYYEVDIAGNFTFLNDSMCRIFGYPKEELMGMNDRQYTDKENAKRLFQAFNKVYRTGEPRKGFDYEIIRKDGTKRNVEASVSLQKDSSGKPIGFRGILRDITERKQAEEALRKGEETATRLAQENAIMAKIGRIISSTLNIDEVYEPFADEVRQVIPFDRVSVNVINPDRASITITYAFGIKVGALQVGDVLPLDDPLSENVVSRRQGILIQVEDESELVNKDYPNLVKHFRAGIRSVMTVPLISKDQVIGIFHLQSLKPNAYTELDLRLAERVGNQIAGAIANAQLFTERKQAEEALRQGEEKYRTILENIEDGYYEVDIAGNFTFLNDSMCRIFGYPKEELMGMNDRQYTDKENAKRLFQAFNKVYRTGEPGKGFDYEIIRRDGTKRNVETSISLQKDSSGKPMGFRGILRDITEKTRMEEQLLQVEKLRALGEMASGVAHDFNNALAAILGNTQLLLHTAKDEDLRGSLKVIEKVAWDSAQTVRRLQEFTRKRVRQELFKINVNDIIRDAIEITKPRWKDEAQAKGIHIDMVSNFDEISNVIGDASELREVITNMIFNAIEAMPKGGRIEIQAFQRKEKVYIQISDTGMGMAEEVRKKIFEPFFTTKPFSNAGLGLSMSYGIIKRFGGEIEVESIIGHGTIFTIILPMGSEGKEGVTISSIIKKEREARILVIDDEETVRSVLSRILSQVKHRVTVAENGEEGIRLFKEEGFDIVLTDLGMPGISGWEVGKAIKKMSPRTPVGMITGWGMEVDQVTIKENGIDFVISKPFQFNQILKVIDETIASKGKLFMT